MAVDLYMLMMVLAWSHHSPSAIDRFNLASFIKFTNITIMWPTVKFHEQDPKEGGSALSANLVDDITRVRPDVT